MRKSPVMRQKEERSEYEYFFFLQPLVPWAGDGKGLVPLLSSCIWNFSPPPVCECISYTHFSPGSRENIMYILSKKPSSEGKKNRGRGEGGGGAEIKREKGQNKAIFSYLQSFNPILCVETGRRRRRRLKAQFIFKSCLSSPSFLLLLLLRIRLGTRRRRKLLRDRI